MFLYVKIQKRLFYNSKGFIFTYAYKTFSLKTNGRLFILKKLVTTILCGMLTGLAAFSMPKNAGHVPPNAPLPSTKHPMNNKNTNLNRIIP